MKIISGRDRIDFHTNRPFGSCGEALWTIPEEFGGMIPLRSLSDHRDEEYLPVLPFV